MPDQDALECPQHGPASKSYDPDGDWTGDWYCGECDWMSLTGWGLDDYEGSTS